MSGFKSSIRVNSIEREIKGYQVFKFLSNGSEKKYS